MKLNKFFAFLKKINIIQFTLFFFLLNLLQIYGTELTSDEGYYWFYSSNLQWGYFDHPPLIAFLVKIGYSLFQNELGIRLFSLIIFTLGVYFLLKLSKNKGLDLSYIYIIILALPLFNYISFILLPDTALIGLSMIALFLYDKILRQNKWIDFLLFGAIFSLMLYAKYHAVLFMFFLLLANLNLLRNIKFYIACLLALILFIPHILWQFENGFPSIVFHLQGRSEGFKSRFFFEFISQQLIAIGPGLIFIPFIIKTKDKFEKTLKYIAVGIFIFMAASTLKGMVHIHWTSLILFPLIILATIYHQNNKHLKLFKYTLIPFIFIIFLLRIYMLVDFIGLNRLGSDYYHGRVLWSKELSKLAEERPILFELGNASLREAPIYSFYSGKPSVAIYPGEHKKSQYQLWAYEDSIHNKDVLVIKKDSFDFATRYRTSIGQDIFYRKVDAFQSIQNIEFELLDKEIINGILSLDVLIKNHRNSKIDDLDKFTYFIQLNTEKGDFIEEIDSEKVVLKSINPNSEISERFYFDVKNQPQGNYKVKFKVVGEVISSTKKFDFTLDKK